MFHAANLRPLIDLFRITSAPASVLREYIERQTYETLLEDQRLDYLYKQYGQSSAIPTHWEAVQSTTPSHIAQAIEQQAGEDQSSKIINYIASFDPTANHHYTQWLVVRWLKNGYQLEDLPNAQQYLQLFETMKRQLPEKDINKYQTLGSLYAALAPFLAGGQTKAVTKGDEKRELYMQMSAPPEAKVLHNDAELRIIHPLTEKASCYWGRNTRWCTAATDSSNYFDSYNKRGPLYIILIKATNKRYQFQFVNDSGSFMDENDSPIDLVAFIDSYPVVMQVLGERNFIPWADQIGVSKFSPDAIKAMSAKQLQKIIKTTADLATIDPEILDHMDRRFLGGLVGDEAGLDAIPEHMKKDLEFQVGLVQMRVPRGHYEVVDYSDRLTWLPEDYYKDNLNELVDFQPRLVLKLPTHLLTPALLHRAITREAALFAKLPDEFKSADLARETAKRFAEVGEYRAIDATIPEAWRDHVVMQYYWRSRIQRDSNLRLAELPHTYWTDENVEKLLRRYPKDMAQHVGVLTDDLVLDMAKLEAFSPNFMSEVPARFCTENLFNHLMSSPAAGNWGTPDRVLPKFPVRLWTKIVVLANLSKIDQFDNIKPEIRDAEVVAKFLLAQPEKTDEVEDRYITPSIITSLFGSSNSYTQKNISSILKHLDQRGLVPSSALARVASTPWGTTQFEKIPESLRTEDVVEAFAEKGVVPVKFLTPALQTDSIITVRVTKHPSEFADIPVQFKTPEFLLELARKNIKVIAQASESLFTEPLLWLLLNKEVVNYYESDRTFRQQQYERFPASLWSARTVAAAIDHHVAKPSMEYFEKFPTNSMAVSLLWREPTLFKQFPEAIRTPTLVARVAMRTPEIVLQLDPGEITEPIAYAVIAEGGKHWKKDRHWANHTKDRQTFEHIPVGVWSKRIYDAAIGRLVDLKDVPSKFRDDAMLEAAVRYRPANILAIKKPVEWLNRVIGTSFDNTNRGEPWLVRMEKAGFIWTKRSQWIDIRTLPREVVDSGYQVAIQAAKVNKKLYLFSPKGAFILFMYTDKGEVHMPYKLDDKQRAKYQPILKEILQKYFAGFAISDLNDRALLYKTTGGTFITSNQLPKKTVGALQYTVAGHGNGTRYEFFLKGKPILILLAETSGAGWGRGVARLHISKIIDYAAVLANGNAFGEWSAKTYYAMNWDMPKLGYVIDRNGSYQDMITRKKIGRLGDLVIYRSESNPERIGIYNLATQDVVAKAKVAKNGRLYNIDTGRYQDAAPAVTAVLEKIAKYLRATKNVAGDLEFDKSVPIVKAIR